jgi:exonuclease III
MYKEDPDNEEPPKIDENLPYTVLSTSTSTPCEKGGVVLLLHKKWQHRVVGKPTYEEHGRWLSVDIRTPKGRTTIIAAYLPLSPQDNATARTAWAKLQDYIIKQHNKKNRLVILAGDLNASLCDPLHK